MKYWYLLAMISGLEFNFFSVNAQEKKPEAVTVGIFDGRTPCQELALQLNQPTIPECNKIKWRLRLYAENTNSQYGSFALEGFVFRKENIMKGKWKLLKGIPSNAEAKVYELVREKNAPIYLLAADQNILFFLDAQKNILVGNRDFSYTLNRVSKD